MSRLILPACVAWLLSAPAAGDAPQPAGTAGPPPAVVAAAQIPRCTPEDAATAAGLHAPDLRQSSSQPAAWAPGASALLIALFVAWRKLKA